MHYASSVYDFKHMLSWHNVWPRQMTFRTEERAVAEAWMASHGYAFEWTADGGLLRKRVGTAFRPHW